MSTVSFTQEEYKKRQNGASGKMVILFQISYNVLGRIIIEGMGDAWFFL